MSSKGKLPAAARGESALAPKLRFTEFREADGWTLLPMGKVYSFGGNNSLSRDKLNYSSGSLRNIHYGDIHTKFSSHFDITKELVPFVNEAELGSIRESSFCSEGDLILADASEDLADIGKCIEITHLNNEKVVAGLHTILAHPAKKQVAVGFGGHLFQSVSVRRQVQREAQGAKVLGISPRRLQDIRLPLPSFSEQQKIADCLASADALIAAQDRKVEALKAHKKGLMQQLFPQEGETQPCLRFPEFEGMGEWSVKPLGKVAENLDNQRVPITSGDRVAGDVPYYGASGIVDYVEGYIFDEDLLCVSEDGANLLARTYPIAFAISGKTWVNNHAHVLRFKHGFTQKLVEVYLNSIKLDEFITGMAQPKLNKAKLDSIPMPLPKEPEQKRIADCLSSLDNLIAAETRKLDTLKTHTKGLMQQLFPQVGEDDA